MNDYGGLGILLEEKEPPPAALGDVPPANVAPPSQNIEPLQPKNEDLLPPLPDLDTSHPKEDLLPPLPNEDGPSHTEDLLPPLPSPNDLLPPLAEDRPSPLPEDSLRDSIIDSIASPNCNSPSLVRNNSEDDFQEPPQDLSEIFLQNSSFFDYELNSPNLNLNTDFHLFPSISSTTTSSHQSPNVTDTSVPTQATVLPPTNTSPLKRLKSLKNGIRKLSFSTSSASSVPPTSTPSSTSLNKLVRPTLNPIQTQTKFQDPATATINRHRHNSSRSSTASSSSSSSGTSSFVNTASTSLFVNQAPPVIVLNKTRKSRTISNCGSVITPLTPPLSSPVITLSENLGSSKRTLSSIEQNYFDTLNSKFSSAMVLDESELPNQFAASVSGTSSPSTSSSTPATARTRVSSISELNSASELLNYSTFLQQQKKSIVDAFELTRRHLIQSGWCSERDLNNLQLQQDSQTSQIDTKLLQIEEKLNKDHKLSMFNAAPMKKNRDVRRTSQESRDPPISPSLKVLESRCFSFADV